MCITSSRKTVRFEPGETQQHCRPGVGRDPGKNAERHACVSLDSGLRRSDEGGYRGPNDWREESRTTARFESGETQQHCRPGVGRDPGENAERHARIGLDFGGQVERATPSGSCATYKVLLIPCNKKLCVISCGYKPEIISLKYGHSTASDPLATPRASAGLAPLAQVDTGGNG